MQELSGLRALVTGGTSGIGRATAEALAREGARVLISGRKEARGAEVVAAIEAGGGDAEFVRADLESPDDVRAFAERPCSFCLWKEQEGKTRTLRRGMRPSGGDRLRRSPTCASRSDGSDAGQGDGVFAPRTSDTTTVTVGASMRMTRHLATSTPDRAAARVTATTPAVAISNHAWKR
jgi:hypothetical protein